MNDILNLAIIGKPLFAEAEVVIKNNHITIKKCEKEESNFLMDTTIDDSKDDFSEMPTVVKEIFNNYKPNRTVETNIELKIQLDNEKPVYQRPRRLANQERDIVENQIKEWPRDGVVEACSSEFASPVVVVRKKDGSLRVCIEYRAVNKKIFQDRFPTPLIEEQQNCRT